MKNDFEFIKASESLKQKTLERAKNEKINEKTRNIRFVPSLIAACMTLIIGFGALAATGAFNNLVKPRPPLFDDRAPEFIKPSYDSEDDCYLFITAKDELRGTKVNDNTRFTEFLFERKTRYNIEGDNAWGLNPENRVRVYVKNKDSEPVSGVTVTALSQNLTALFTAKTDNSGCAYLFAENIECIGVSDGEHSSVFLKTDNEMTLTFDGEKSTSLDIMFAFSGSKTELNYLKRNLDLSEVPADTRYSALYVGGESAGFTYEVSEFRNRISAINSKKSDLDVILDTAVSADWRSGAVKLLFLVVDSSSGEKEKIRRAVLKAARNGIRIIPVFCEKTGSIEMFRTCAVLTGGECIILVDSTNATPLYEKYEIKNLKDLINEVIKDYTE